MNPQEILGKIQNVFDTVFVDTVKVTPELSAADVEEWDSVQHISLVLGIEKAFQIRFKMGEVEKAKNIGQLSEIISKKLEK